MITRKQYRCSFKQDADESVMKEALDKCKDKAASLIKEDKLCNVSFYRYENMGFLYMESFFENKETQPEVFMAELEPYLKLWPDQYGDVFFTPMINVYYHHIPEENPDIWEHERTTDVKTRVGRIAFVFPDKLPSYVMHHNAIVEEGLLKGDKYAFISMHENLLFSYYEEPRNNVNIKNSDE